MNTKTEPLTNEERVSYTLRKLHTWLDNYQTNLAHYEEMGDEDAARRVSVRIEDVRDIIAMLDGSEDDYISATAYAAELRARKVGEANA